MTRVVQGFWDFIVPIEERISVTDALRMGGSGAFIMVGSMILKGAVWSNRGSRAAARIGIRFGIPLIHVKRLAELFLPTWVRGSHR
jgi:hypothetical protein